MTTWQAAVDELRMGEIQRMERTYGALTASKDRGKPSG